MTCNIYLNKLFVEERNAGSCQTFYELVNCPNVQKHEVKSQGRGSAIKDVYYSKLKACWPEIDLWDTDAVGRRHTKFSSHLHM